MMFQRFTHGNQFQCTQSDQPETAEHAYYTENHELDIMKSGFGEAMLHLTKSIFGCRMEASKVYTNAMQFGDALFAHTDATGMTPGIETNDFATALTYTNPTWGVDWGGETVFYDGQCFDVSTGKLNTQGEIIASVIPKPGRVAIFDARVRHSGRPPQKIFLGRRFTTAMKLNCPWKTPPLLPYDKEYFEKESEIRKAVLTAADRVPGRIRPRYDLRESLKEL
jgi:Rps23 Pro-64 3,4-dihydroxylase Tpa1-like proline 4-hydroxylase